MYYEPGIITLIVLSVGILLVHIICYETKEYFSLDAIKALVGRSGKNHEQKLIGVEGIAMEEDAQRKSYILG